jgi:hypothetical protein
MQITAASALLVGLLFVPTAAAGQAAAPPAGAKLPRTADGKPDLGGIWQVHNTAASDLLAHAAKLHMPAGTAVVAGNEIPYQPLAAAKRLENFQHRATADPLAQCFMPGVPRIMYLDFPFQIFQTPQMLAMTFEWSSVHRQIYTDGSSHVDGIEFWMGDSRGRWEGDTLVVDVTNHNDKTWFDMAGNFHSEALKLVERYTLVDADTIQYEVSVEDPKVFTRPWKISMPFHRHKEMDRILEYQCQAEVEEANGAFPRQPVTWYPEPGAPPSPAGGGAPAGFNPQQAARPKPAVNSAAIRRRPDGKPDLQGTYVSDGGGANFGLEPRASSALSPAGRGIVVDPPDGRLPTQAWAKAEHESRARPERGYDDPTAHCFVAGVPRSMYVPQPYYIMQTDTHVVLLFERMSYRVVPTDGRGHLPDRIRLWQGDSIGRWDGDTLVVETTNLNGKTWLNEAGEIVSHAETVVERFTPVDADTLHYEATVTDPIVYNRPWTISFPIKRQTFELLEVACHEDDQDLPRLKAIKDAAVY